MGCTGASQAGLASPSASSRADVPQLLHTEFGTSCAVQPHLSRRLWGTAGRGWRQGKRCCAMLSPRCLWAPHADPDTKQILGFVPGEAWQRQERLHWSQMPMPPERKAQSLPSHSFFFLFSVFFFFPPLWLILKKPRRFGLRETQMPFAASSLDPISNIPALESKTVYEVDGEL